MPSDLALNAFVMIMVGFRKERKVDINYIIEYSIAFEIAKIMARCFGWQPSQRRFTLGRELIGAPMRKGRGLFCCFLQYEYSKQSRTVHSKRTV